VNGDQDVVVLSVLRISGFALIDELELELGPGLTVITGETGAGKSIIVEALGLLRGGRASADLIRSGRDEARVEAIIELPAATGAELRRARPVCWSAARSRAPGAAGSISPVGWRRRATWWRPSPS
jgi:hypothetical protein